MTPPPPELGRREAGPRGERFKLSPHHLRMHASDGFRLRESAIGPGDDGLPSHEPGEPHDAIRDHLRMLYRDHVVCNDPGNKYFSGRQFDALPYAPFVLMPRIRRF